MLSTALSLTLAVWLMPHGFLVAFCLWESTSITQSSLFRLNLDELPSRPSSCSSFVFSSPLCTEWRWTALGSWWAPLKPVRWNAGILCPSSTFFLLLSPLFSCALWTFAVVGGKVCQCAVDRKWHWSGRDRKASLPADRLLLTERRLSALLGHSYF